MTNRRYVLGSVFSLLLANPAYAAIDCAVPPSCKEMGYVYKTTDCEGKAVLRCPFELENDNAVFCAACPSGYILLDDVCQKTYATCEEAGYVSPANFACSDCVNGNVDPVILYDSEGKEMKCYDSCCASDSSTACDFIIGANDRKELFDTDGARHNINMLTERVSEAPSLNNIDAEECYSKYVSRLSAVSEDDDFAVYGA